MLPVTAGQRGEAAGVKKTARRGLVLLALLASIAMLKSVEGWESANIIKMWKNVKSGKNQLKKCVPPQYVQK
jgi:hypothetical protein